MAIINSYPLATPKLTDLVLGTSTSSTGQTSTKSFTVQSIKDTTAGVQTITTTIPATLNITGSGTANVVINAVTAAITSGSAALATSGDIYTFLTGKITGTPNTVPIWTNATTLGDSLISQAANGVIINGNSTDGKLTLNCSATTHGVTLQSPPHSAGATYTWVLPQGAGTAGQVLTSGGGATDQLTWSTNGNVAGTGTANKLSKWSNATTLADSNVEDTGTLVTISSAAKVTGNLELDADLIDVNGGTGTAGQLLSSLGTGNGIDWIDAPVTGVITVTDGNTAGVNEGITIAGTASNPTVAADIGAVSSSSFKLATGNQIQTAIDSALAGALTFKGTFNATTGQIVSGSNNGSYLYNCPGGAGTRVAISVGDLYVASTAGSFYCTGSSLNVADEVIATADAAADSSVVGNWSVVPSSGGGITGNGTTNAIPRWDGTTVLADSVIAQSGTNIGIGTTSPTELLYVNASSGDARIGLNAVAGSDTEIKFSNAGTVQYTIGHDDGTDNFVIGTANVDTPKVSITKNGNVGIGTASPATNLEVTSTGNTTVRISTDGDAVDKPEIQLFRNIGDYGSIRYEPGGGNNSGIHLIDNRNDANSHIIFETRGENERMRIESDGQIKFNEYTSASAFTGTAVANLAVDSSGNIITDTGGGGLPTKTVDQDTIANATTGTITLTVSPTSENYTDMYVSGVYQNKSTYSLSGSTITLDGGAYFPNGAIVEVVSTT